VGLCESVMSWFEESTSSHERAYLIVVKARRIEMRMRETWIDRSDPDRLQLLRDRVAQGGIPLGAIVLSLTHSSNAPGKAKFTWEVAPLPEFRGIVETESFLRQFAECMEKEVEQELDTAKRDTEKFTE
jgi:hypothetical protein